MQLFDSWAHTLTPEEFSSFSLPYAQKVIDGVREKRPGTPLMFHANGGKHSCPSENTASPAALPVRYLQCPDILSLALHFCHSGLCRLCLHSGACWWLDSTSEPINKHRIETAYMRARIVSPASQAVPAAGVGKLHNGWKCTHRHIMRMPHTEHALQQQSHRWALCPEIAFSKYVLRLAVGVGKLHRMTGCSADVLGLDWSTDIAEARQVLGSDRVIQGNVDPAVLFASEACPKLCVTISMHSGRLDTNPLYLPLHLPCPPSVKSSGLVDHLCMLYKHPAQAPLQLG